MEDIRQDISDIRRHHPEDNPKQTCGGLLSSYHSGNEAGPRKTSHLRHLSVVATDSLD